MVTQPALKQTEQEPSIYHGCGFAVSEIETSLAFLSLAASDLSRANIMGRAVDQKLASEVVSRHAKQIVAMAETITRVTCGYLARKPRV